MRRRRTLAPPSRRGVAATEFAVCLPVLVMLLLGIIEACTMIFVKQSLSAAAYEGAHTAVLDQATVADVRATSDAILADRRVRGGTVTVTPANLAALAPGSYFEVRVTAPADANGVLPLNFFRGRTLSATATMMKEI